MSIHTVTLSGLYYPNQMGRLYIDALNEVMGESGLNSILRLARLDTYIGNFPPNNLERKFDFAEFTALSVALEDMFGPRGGRGLALRAGRVCFSHGLKNFGAMVGAGDLAFRVLPLPAKLKMGLPALASIFTNFSDQLTEIQEYDDHYAYVIKKCPVCWGRHTDKAVCHVSTGVLQEGLRWVSGGREFRVVESECIAKGDAHCVFAIYKTPVDQA
jgi:predicted hydrocarbon binding protein